jgi:hypothetical protein
MTDSNDTPTIFSNTALGGAETTADTNTVLPFIPTNIFVIIMILIILVSGYLIYYVFNKLNAESYISK